MHTDYSRQIWRSIFLFASILALISTPVLGQNNRNNSPQGSFYRQAYDQGFRAGQTDYRARRPYNYQTALVTVAGASAISGDYRTAFRTGYQDGYAGHNRSSDWYYRNHQHNADCRENDDRENGKWDCGERHDNGKHKGWYKNRRPKDDNQGDDNEGN